MSATATTETVSITNTNELRSLAIVVEHLDVLADIQGGETFRTKHRSSISHGDILRLKQAGLIADKGWAQLADWGLTELGRQLVSDALECDVPELTEYQVEALAKHSELILSELPGTDETFEGSEAGLAPRELAHLRRASLVVAEEEYVGSANEWAISTTAEELRATLELAEQPIDGEAKAEATAE